MSYLYSTFAQLVSVHCKATAATSTVPVNQCKRDLLSYGYEKLQTFSNEQLDLYDPYQRGAGELIWSSIMRDHPSATLIANRKAAIPIPPATSIVILTHQKPVKPSSSHEAKHESSIEVLSNSPTHAQEYPQNPIFETKVDKSHEYAMEMDIAYGYPDRHDSNSAQVEVFDVPKHEHNQQKSEEKKHHTFLTGGPLVVRVRPDGTPIDGNTSQLPVDDDREAFYVNTDAVLPANASEPASQFIRPAPGRPTKHRKIATISALKHNLALQRQLQPPLVEPSQELLPPIERARTRLQYPAMPNLNDYATA